MDDYSTLTAEEVNDFLMNGHLPSPERREEIRRRIAERRDAQE